MLWHTILIASFSLLDMIPFSLVNIYIIAHLKSLQWAHHLSFLRDSSIWMCLFFKPVYELYLLVAFCRSYFYLKLYSEWSQILYARFAVDAMYLMNLLD